VSADHRDEGTVGSESGDEDSFRDASASRDRWRAMREEVER